MGKQVKVNLTIDADIVKEAKEIGLNMSKISENALKEAIKRLKGSNPTNNSEKGGIGTAGSDKWAGQYPL